MDIHIGIDVGGTFTDLAVTIPSENRQIRHKLSSTPDRPDDAIVEGIARVLADHDLDAGDVIRLSHGTTVGTNALIQRKVGTVAVITGEGFRDLLEIGRQVRPKVYDIHLDFPKPLVPRRLRLEVAGRRRADGSVHVPLDEKGLRAAGRRLAEEGVDCVTVCFLHSYAYPEDEARAVEILREVLPGDIYVQSSNEVYPEFREYERFSTAVLNGALLTVVDAYLDRFSNAVADLGVPVEPKVSQSGGGLMSVHMTRKLPIRACLSGPAAGVIGAAHRAPEAGYRNVITLDVGGTSADVSVLVDGEAMEVHNRMLAGFPLRLPALDVNAVGAGAHPGPACYGLGGTEATLTDANVLLGRLNDRSFLDGGMGILTDDGPVEAGGVVNASGPWSKFLAESAGLALDLRSVREQDTVWEARDDRPIPEVSISNGVDAIYLRPLGQRRFVVGRGFSKDYIDVDPYNYQETADEDFVSDVQSRLEHRFPPFAGARRIDSYAALYDVTPDWYPFVGPRSGLKGYYDACGGSGHGFKIGAAMGRHLADWIRTGAVQDDFAQLIYDRVSAGELFVGAYGGNRA